MLTYRLFVPANVIIFSRSTAISEMWDVTICLEMICLGEALSRHDYLLALFVHLCGNKHYVYLLI